MNSATSQRQQHSWRGKAGGFGKSSLTVTGVGASKDDAKPTAFQILPSTRIWKGTCLGTSADLDPGQSVTINLTVCTLKGPGRAVEIWLDAKSREAASAQQLEVHRQF